MTAHGGVDLLPSTTPPWRCYTGRVSGSHSNAFTTLDYGVRDEFLRQNKPERKGDSFHWVAITDATDATIDQLALVDGRGLWRAVYRSTKPAVAASHPEAVVFMLATAEYLLRPFLVLCLDETDTFESYIESTSEVPFSLMAEVSVAGSGQYYSQYRFTFLKGLPRFLGRTDGGRHSEPETFK